MSTTSRRDGLLGISGRGDRGLAGLVALAATLVVGGLLPAGCAVNPATGERQLALIGTDEEIRMGREGAAQVQASMGLYDGQGLQGYVEEVGLRMARDTERPDLPWSFAVADEPVVNAFALPGGFIYLTRGILAHFNSEAEMAAVLGHEIGHVTARHSVEQMSQQQLARIGLGLGAVLSDEVAAASDLLGAGLGVLFLKFSRDDERQADRLGFRYMSAHGFDPREMVDVFQTFRRMSEAQGGSGVPSWLSTHPTPVSRIEEVRQMIDSVAPERLSGTRTGRGDYLQRLEGMVYGPDPRNGFFRGDRFVHPELELRLDFPAGWKRTNLARMVAAQSSEGDAQVQLMLAEAASPREAADAFLGDRAVQAVDTDRTEIHGFPAVVVEFRAQGQQDVLRGLAAFVGDGSRVYRLLGVSVEASYGRRASTFRRFVGSFDRLSDPDALNVEPMRVTLLTPDRETTVAELRSRRDAPLSAEALARLNALEPEERIPAGRTIKWVTGRLPEAMRDGGA